jgi:hypothetical protein
VSLYDAGRRLSIWLNRRTTDRDPDWTFSAKSHALALEGRWMGYLRCVVIDAVWAAWEGSHCRKAYEHWRDHA